MTNLELAMSLYLEAREFNVFGSANLRGNAYQLALRTKFENWLNNKSITFDPNELSVLKSIIAQWLVRNQMESLVTYPFGSDNHLTPEIALKRRIVHCLDIAKALAKCGSFNCEIGNLVLCLALRRQITIPIELILFSGVRDDGRDNLHTFIALGNTRRGDNKALSTALLTRRYGYNLEEEEREEFADYVVCDAYHGEAYRVTDALLEADRKLARYDNINHLEKPLPRRFIYIENPSELYRNDHEIRAKCDEVTLCREDQILKNRVMELFHEALLTPFSKVLSPEQSFRGAAANGMAHYLREINKEFNVDINTQDGNPNSRMTALHLAARNNWVECAHILLEWGANFRIENAQNITAMTLMQSSTNNDIVDLIAQYDVVPGVR